MTLIPNPAPEIFRQRHLFEGRFSVVIFTCKGFDPAAEF